MIKLLNLSFDMESTHELVKRRDLIKLFKIKVTPHVITSGARDLSAVGHTKLI